MADFLIYMVGKKIANNLSNPGRVAGTVHSAACLKTAERVRRGGLDFFEIRADAFAGREEELLGALPRLKAR